MGWSPIRNIPGTSLSMPRYCFILGSFFQSKIKTSIPAKYFTQKTQYACGSSRVSVYLLLHVSVCECECVCVCGKGETHCLLPCCHWAVSPNQQPCRPDRRWARLLLQPILCSPSAAPDSAGRSPLEEGRWSDESERGRGKRDRRGREKERERKRRRETSLVRQNMGEERCFGGNPTSFYFLKNRIGVKQQLGVLKQENCLVFHTDRHYIKINLLAKIRNSFRSFLKADATWRFTRGMVGSSSIFFLNRVSRRLFWYQWISKSLRKKCNF